MRRGGECAGDRMPGRNGLLGTVVLAASVGMKLAMFVADLKLSRNRPRVCGDSTARRMHPRYVAVKLVASAWT